MNIAINDIVESLKRWRLILFLSLTNVKARYNRSVLGPLWLTLGTAGGSAGLGFLWSELLKVPREQFIPSLTAGLIIWQFISGIISDGVHTFSRNGNIIKNTAQPLFIYPVQLVIQHFINLLHTLPVFFIVLWLLDIPLKWEMLWAIPCIILLIFNLLWMALLFGILGARFRDLEFIFNMIIPLLFFISPVMYRPNYLPFNENIIWWNPFSHLIELVRQPLLGYAPQHFVIETNFAFLVMGWILAIILFSLKRKRIAFWV